MSAGLTGVRLLERRLGIVGALRLESGERWADVAHGFQIETARHVLDPDAPPYSYTVRARGASKTSDLSAAALALLLTAPDRARLYWGASDGAQAALGLDAIAGYQARTEELHGSLDIQARRVIATASGATIDFLPADEAGSWGLLPFATFLDELSAWGETRGPQRLLDAFLTAAGKVPGSKVAVLTSAGSPRHFAHRLLEHARGDPLWRTFELAGPPPWADPERLAEQKRRLPEPVWRQLFGGEWLEAEGDFLSEEMVDAAFVLPGPSLRPEASGGYVGALDLGAVHDATVFGVGHREAGRIVLDHMRVWRGTRSSPVSFAEVEQHIAATYERGFRFALSGDPWQGLGMFERLRARGIRVEPFSFSTGSKMRLASTLLAALSDGGLQLFEVEGLRDELIGLRLKQGSGGAWSFDSAAGGRDDMAVCLALLCVAALEARPGSGSQYCGSCGRPGTGSMCPCRFEESDGPVTHRAGLELRGDHHRDRPPPSSPNVQSLYAGH